MGGEGLSLRAVSGPGVKGIVPPPRMRGGVAAAAAAAALEDPALAAMVAGASAIGGRAKKSKEVRGRDTGLEETESSGG
jgi:hypothetical protein